MGRFIKLLLILAVAIGIGVAVAKMNEMKQLFLAMSEEEQREFLAEKLGDKVPEEKLAEIQDKVIEGIAKATG